MFSYLYLRKISIKFEGAKGGFDSYIRLLTLPPLQYKIFFTFKFN